MAKQSNKRASRELTLAQLLADGQKALDAEREAEEAEIDAIFEALRQVLARSVPAAVRQYADVEYDANGDPGEGYILIHLKDAPHVVRHRVEFKNNRWQMEGGLALWHVFEGETSIYGSKRLDAALARSLKD